MEDYSNEMQNENSPKNKLLNDRNLMSKDDLKNINEEHILSLRKKKNSKSNEILKKIYAAPQILSHDIDLKNLILLIQNDPLYIKYNSIDIETEKLNYLFQMLLSENLNILKYSLIELKAYLNNINDPNEFNFKMNLMKKCLDFYLVYYSKIKIVIQIMKIIIKLPF